MRTVYEEALELHKKWKGKIEVHSKVAVKTAEDLTLAYTPGVAEPCREINKDVNCVYNYTGKGNLIAVVSDGTAVLGLGDIGPEASIPVMEGKCVLFKEFGGVNAVPICLKTKDVDEIVKTVKLLEPVFGGINLEDIGAPRCFEIEKRLIEEMNIPVFHDDQHGTAVVILAAIINAAKVVKKNITDMTVVINGSGAAGIATGKLLLRYGVKDVILCDRTGAIFQGREKLGGMKTEMAEITNKKHRQGSLTDVIQGADVFLGVSTAGVLTREMVTTMAEDAIIFAMANPVPEIMPEEAAAGSAAVIGTGRSDFSNQINNVLVFPGMFRGALDARASKINDEMKIAAAEAIAALITPEELHAEYIIPAAFDPRVRDVVSNAVAKAARETGVARA